MIVSERISLRLPEESDIPALMAAVTPTVSRWTSWPHPLTDVECRSRITTSLSAYSTRSQIPLLIVDLKSNSVMGWIRVRRDADRMNVGLLGYWLSDPYHGRGFMGESVRALLHNMPASMMIDYVEAIVDPNNAASGSVLRKAGMIRVGSQKKDVTDTHLHDLYRFSLSR